MFAEARLRLEAELCAVAHLVGGQFLSWLLDEDATVHNGGAAKSFGLGPELHGDLLPRDGRAVGKLQRHLGRTRGNTAVNPLAPAGCQVTVTAGPLTLWPKHFSVSKSTLWAITLWLGRMA